jgi:peptidoglycan biosynthesis protein MviN/MurJ (putative lipid II flippase)
MELPKEENAAPNFALAIGVLAAGVAQAAFQLPTLWRDGFSAIAGFRRGATKRCGASCAR